MQLVAKNDVPYDSSFSTVVDKFEGALSQLVYLEVKKVQSSEFMWSVDNIAFHVLIDP